MLASNIRVFLAIAYVALLLWQTRAEGHPPEYWWVVIAVYFVSIRLSYGAESAWQWWRNRRVIQLWRSLDPSVRNTELGRMWMASVRHAIRELVDAEGQIEVGGAVERYPFARGAKVETVVGFWSAMIGGLVLYAGLILFSRRLPEQAAWGIWAIGTVALLVTYTLRKRMDYLESTLEINRFRIAEALRDGTRRTVTWGTPLFLRYRRWPRRLELIAPERREIVRLDFDRVGIDRAVRLTLEYGDFHNLLSSAGDAA